MMSVLERSFHAFLDVLFPPQCVSCKRRLLRSGSRTPVICDACFSAIPISSGFFCPACKKRLYEPRVSCHRDARFVAGAATPFDSLQIQALIHALKYQSCRNAAFPLAALLHAYCGKMKFFDSFSSALLIPIPLYPRRERARGFNQAACIAQSFLSLSHNLNVALDSKNLVRTRNTSSQTKQKTYEDRRKNVEGSFSLRRPDLVRGRNIILLDDVYTSGATVSEAVRILKQAGARRIVALTVAKA